MRALERLQARGFEGYLVGGCVRDLLLHRRPKDFDIATAARPQQIKRVFPRNCRIIGRRFKLAHLHFEQNTKILEVATFRTLPIADNDGADDLLITRDNEFGTAEEDALRRDFTVNALFFDPIADRILDYVGGLDDVRAGLLRTIGDPVVRFREDPVRIIRAAKFAGRLAFAVEAKTYEAMAEVAPDLARSAPPRLLEEILRLLRGGHSLASFQILRDIGALRVIAPVIADFLAQAAEPERVRFWRTLEAVDHKVLSGIELPTAVLLGALFACPVRLYGERDPGRSTTTVAESIIGPFARELRLSRRDAGCLKRICGVQARFWGRGSRRFKPHAFLRDPYFREALQLFELTCVASGEGVAALRQWRELGAQAGHDDGGTERDAAGDQPRELPEDSDQTEVGAYAGGGSESESESESGSEFGSGSGRGRRRRRRRRRGRGGAGAFGGSGEGAGPAHPARPADTPTDHARADACTTTSTTTSRNGTGSGGTSAAKRRRRRGRGRGEGASGTGAAPAAPMPAAATGGRAEGRRRRKRRDRNERDTSVETLEPAALDVTAFDVELGPRDVPTFGVIIEEGGAKRKRRAPRVPPEGDDEYRPPPPPSNEPEPPAPPSSDEFGDW